MSMLDKISTAVSAGAVEVYDLAAEILGTSFERLSNDYGEAVAIEAQKWAKGWACWFCYQPKNAAKINAAR
jgi:hypothetical protein